MADLTQTAANVGLKTAATTLTVQAGEAITQGMPVYLSNSKYYKADNGAVATAAVAGIAMTGGAADDYITIATAGNVDLGATLTVGEIYILSAAGAISPVGDAATSDVITILGVASAADTLILSVNASGVTAA